MTLQEATKKARAAAGAGDLAALHEALAARAAAIRKTRDPDEMKAALLAGESIARDLRLLKLKLSTDFNRLGQIQAALLSGLGAPPRGKIQFRG